MDRTIPPPDVLSTEVPIETLTGTAKTIASSAARAGFEVKAVRALGPRVPRRVNDPVYRQSSTSVVGKLDGWRFTANVTERDGWECVLHRPGWPAQFGNTSMLTAVFKAMTPAEVV